MSRLIEFGLTLEEMIKNREKMSQICLLVVAVEMFVKGSFIPVNPVVMRPLGV
jgi:hypothetical protein